MTACGREKPAPPQSAQIPGRLADAGLLAITLIWGSTFFVVKDALATVSPLEFLALRFGLAFLSLIVVFPRRLVSLDRASWIAGGTIGLFLLAGYVFQTVGLGLTTATRAGFITGLSVLFVPGLAWLALRQRIDRGVIVAVPLAIAGLWLLSGDGTTPLGFGDFLVLGCALAFAAQIVAVGAFGVRHRGIDLAIVQIGVTALGAAVLALVFEQPSLHMLQELAEADRAVIAIIFTGLIATALALSVQNHLQRHTTAARAALVFTLEPVFAATFAALFGGERLGFGGLIGGSLILAAVLYSEVKRA